MHLPFHNFIFDDRHYNLTACQKSFELPWHELLSPVLLNINHYHRCLFWLVFELLPAWCEQSNLGFVQTRFSRSNLTEKMEMFYFLTGAKGNGLCACVVLTKFLPDSDDRPRHQDGLFKGKNSKLQHARCSMIFSWMTWFRYLFTVIIRFKTVFNEIRRTKICLRCQPKMMSFLQLAAEKETSFLVGISNKFWRFFCQSFSKSMVS